jgi:hypothetical protein
MQFFKRILNFDEATVANHEQRLARRFPLGQESPLSAWLVTPSGKIAAQILNLSSSGAGLVLPINSVSPPDGQTCHIVLKIEDNELSLKAKVARTHAHPDGLGIGLDLTDNDYASRRNLVQLLEPIEIGSSLRSVDRKSVSQTEPGLLSIRYFSSTSCTLTIWRDIESHAISGFEMRMHQYHVRSGRQPPELKFYVDEVAGGSGYGLPTLRPSAETDEEVLRLFKWVVPHLNAELPRDVKAYLSRFTPSASARSTD